MIFRIDWNRCATKDCLFLVNKSYALSKYEWIGQAYTLSLDNGTEPRVVFSLGTSELEADERYLLS